MIKSGSSGPIGTAHGPNWAAAGRVQPKSAANTTAAVQHQFCLVIMLHPAWGAAAIR